MEIALDQELPLLLTSPNEASQAVFVGLKHTIINPLTAIRGLLELNQTQLPELFHPLQFFYQGKIIELPKPEKTQFNLEDIQETVKDEARAFLSRIRARMGQLPELKNTDFKNLSASQSMEKWYRLVSEKLSEKLEGLTLNENDKNKIKRNIETIARVLQNLVLLSEKGILPPFKPYVPKEDRSGFHFYFDFAAAPPPIP